MILLLLRGQGVFLCLFPFQLSRPGAVRLFCPCRVTDCRRLGTPGRPPVDAHSVHGTHLVPKTSVRASSEPCALQWPLLMVSGCFSGIGLVTCRRPDSWPCWWPPQKAAVQRQRRRHPPLRRRACSRPILDTPATISSSSRCTTAALFIMLYMRSAHRGWTGVAGGGPTQTLLQLQLYSLTRATRRCAQTAKDNRSEENTTNWMNASKEAHTHRATHTHANGTKGRHEKKQQWSPSKEDAKNITERG